MYHVPFDENDVTRNVILAVDKLPLWRQDRFTGGLSLKYESLNLENSLQLYQNMARFPYH